MISFVNKEWCSGFCLSFFHQQQQHSSHNVFKVFFSDDQQGKWPSVDINDALLNHDIVLDTFFVAFLHSGIPCFMKGETECITTAKKPIVWHGSALSIWIKLEP